MLSSITVMLADSSYMISKRTNGQANAFLNLESIGTSCPKLGRGVRLSGRFAAMSLPHWD
jgi:hypothetical protein